NISHGQLRHIEALRPVTEHSTFLKHAHQAIQRVMIRNQTFTAELDLLGLLQALLESFSSGQDDNLGELHGKSIRIDGAVRIHSRCVNFACLPDSSNQRASTLRVLARAIHWLDLLATGAVSNLSGLEMRTGLTDRYIRRVLRLGSLAPRLAILMLEGRI